VYQGLESRPAKADGDEGERVAADRLKGAGPCSRDDFDVLPEWQFRRDGLRSEGLRDEAFRASGFRVAIGIENPVLGGWEIMFS
jgi:hypothetical protein